jgi:hypothetical protein
MGLRELSTAFDQIGSGGLKMPKMAKLPSASKAPAMPHAHLTAAIHAMHAPKLPSALASSSKKNDLGLPTPP